MTSSRTARSKRCCSAAPGWRECTSTCSTLKARLFRKWGRSNAAAGGIWTTFFSLIPGGAPPRFRLRLHNEASQWLLIDTLRLRLRDTAGSTGSAAASSSPIPNPQSPIPLTSKQADELQQTWSKRVGAAVQWTNLIGMKFTLVPPGRFSGTDLDEPYYLGIYKVTQEEYQRVMGTNPMRTRQPAAIKSK